MLWRTLDESRVPDRNNGKLKKSILKLEEEIVLRYHDLARESGPDGDKAPKETEELQVLRRTARRLRELKLEKLSLPYGTSQEPAKATAMHEVKKGSILSSIQWSRIRWRCFRADWRKLVGRVQATLLVTERAWQDWVFKGSK